MRDAISRINRTSRRRFRETFEAVSKSFSENFPRLYVLYGVTMERKGISKIFAVEMP